jgi:hypothetical protein
MYTVITPLRRPRASTGSLRTQWRLFVERHTRETKLAVSIALTLGKAAQLELAQDAVARAAAGLAYWEILTNEPLTDACLRSTAHFFSRFARKKIT